MSPVVGQQGKHPLRYPQELPVPQKFTMLLSSSFTAILTCCALQQAKRPAALSIVKAYHHTKINFTPCGCFFSLPVISLLMPEVIVTRQDFSPDPSEFPEILGRPQQQNDTPSISSSPCIVFANPTYCAFKINPLDRAFFSLGTRGSHSKQAMCFFLLSRLLSFTDNTTLFIGTLIY